MYVVSPMCTLCVVRSEMCARGHVNTRKVGVHVRYLCVCEICAHVMCVYVMYTM